MRKEFISESEDDTIVFGIKLGENARPGDVFALSGDLGCGKTVLAKGIALGMGIKDEITSPTFALLEIYESEPELYHFDLYRIETPHELDQLFFEEYWEGEGISIVEWAERAGKRLPRETIHITLTYINESRRSILIEQTTD
jgi:tRNA threonylcarbamoyladenosine biosynthesis protein TsaE